MDTLDIELVTEMLEQVTGTSYERIKKLHSKAKDYWSPTFAAYAEDMRFAAGQQWDSAVELSRKSANRPAEVYNIIPSFIRPITNAVREAPPGIQIHPVSNGTRQQAMALAGVCRAIEKDSSAQITYCQALDMLCRGGVGSWRVILDENDKATIELIPDPTKLLMDPAARAIDFSDARFCIYESCISIDEYKEMYPNGQCTENEADVVEIFEYWGKTKRGTIEFVVYDSNGELDRQELPVCILPYVVLTADRLVLDGKVTYTSAIRDIKTLQREINYYKSEALAVLASAPKSTWMAQEGTLVNPEKWRDSSVAPDVVLEYARNAQIAPAAILAPPVPEGYVAVANGNIDLMRNITGIYPDPSTQATLSNASGKAIKSQMAAAQISTKQWIEALQAGVRLTGDIILDYVKNYYSDDQIRTSIGADNHVTPVSIGPTNIRGAVNIDLGQSEYKVTVSVGASYNNAVEQAMDRLMEIGKANPAIYPLITDWMISQINVPGSEELADRFRVMLPPEVQAISQAGDIQQDPGDVIRRQQMQMMQMQQQLQMAGQQMQMMQQQLAQATDARAMEEAKLQNKIDINNDNIRAKMTLQDDSQEHDVRMANLEAKFDMMYNLVATHFRT